MSAMIFGLFGSSINSVAHRDVDLFAFGHSRVIRPLELRIVRGWNAADIQRLSLNGYGGGGGDGGGRGRSLKTSNEGIFDVTLFDDRECFEAFLQRNPDCLLTASSSERFWSILKKKANADAVRFMCESVGWRIPSSETSV